MTELGGPPLVWWMVEFVICDPVEGDMDGCEDSGGGFDCIPSTCPDAEEVDGIGVGFWGLGIAVMVGGCGGCWIAGLWFIAENVAAEDPTPRCNKSPAIELFDTPTTALAAVAENIPLTFELLWAKDPELLLKDGGPKIMKSIVE